MFFFWRIKTIKNQFKKNTILSCKKKIFEEKSASLPILENTFGALTTWVSHSISGRDISFPTKTSYFNEFFAFLSIISRFFLCLLALRIIR